MDRFDLRAIGWVVVRDACVDAVRAMLGRARAVPPESLPALAERWRALVEARAVPAAESASADGSGSSGCTWTGDCVAAFARALAAAPPHLYAPSALRRRFRQALTESIVGWAGAIVFAGTDLLSAERATRGRPTRRIGPAADEGHTSDAGCARSHCTDYSPLIRRRTVPVRNALSATVVTALASLIAPAACAQVSAPENAPDAAVPEHTLAANVSVGSEYIFRGIAQTRGKPTLQGGFDYAHASGLYLGTWGSNVSWLTDFGTYAGGSLEWDFYGGYKASFPGNSDWNYDIGTLYYYYPGTRNPGAIGADTWEIYGAVNWKWLGAKVSYSLGDYFGARPTGQKMDGTVYVDLYANYPVRDSGFVLLAHYGVLDGRHDGSGDSKVSYEDWKLGVSYTVPAGTAKGIEVGAYYTGNTARKPFYTDLAGYDTAKDRAVMYVKKTF